MTITTTPIDEPLAGQIRRLLSQVDSTTVPSGVLVWFGDAHFPDGNDADPPTLSLSEWTSIYLRLFGGARPSRLPPPPSVVPGGAAQPGEPIPLVIASIEYQRPSAVASEAAVHAAGAGTAAELPSELADNVETAHTFIAAASLAGQIFRDLPATRGRSFQLRLDQAGLISNSDTDISDVTVDADDGLGPRPLPVGGTIEIDPPEGVTALQLTVTAATAVGPRTARCSIAISDDPVPTPPDEVLAIGSSETATGRLMIFRADGASGERLSNPILIAEGFPGGHSPQYLFEMVNQHQLLERWQASGRDVVVIGFDNGKQAIQANASVVRAAIDHVTRRTHDTLMVSGWSMGGLVTRFALAQMETEGVDHHTDVYFTVDTPHGRGAYTTVCGQWFCQEFGQLSPAIAGAQAVLASTANDQFLGLRVHGDTVGPSAARLAFLEDLAAVGWYPQNVRRLAVACGSGAGAVGATAPAEPMMTWSTNGFGDVVLRHLVDDGRVTIGTGTTMGAIDASPEPLSAATDVCWEITPGAREAYFDAVVGPVRSLGIGDVSISLEVGCSMPTVSALDLDIDPFAKIPAPGAVLSPFHDFATNATDQHHLQLTADLADWIFDRVARNTGDARS